MGDMVLFDSIVKHHNLFFWKPVKEDWIEGHRNRAAGEVRNNKFKVDFTNSYGHESVVEGNYKRLGPFVFLTGVAHGYKDFPNGRAAVSVGMFIGKTLTLLVPAFDSQYLSITLKYKRID